MLISWLDQFSFGKIIVLGNSIAKWISVLLILGITLFATCILLSIFKRIIKLHLPKKEKFSDTLTIEVLRCLTPIIYICFAAFILRPLELGKITPLLRQIPTIIIILSSIFLISRAIYLYLTCNTTKNSYTNTLLHLFPLINTILWSCGIIFLLGNLGVNVSTLVTGLGIGGIAVAMAAQSILGDVLSYLSILMDKPFEQGDTITLSDDSIGSVEKIGIKTTKIRSVNGEQIIVPNSNLVSSCLKNYQRMEQRRVVQELRIEYKTNYEKLQLIKNFLVPELEKNRAIEINRLHLKELGEFAIIFELVYYVQSGDYLEFMEQKEQVNFCILKFLEKNNIDFSFPSQSIYVEKLPISK